MHVPVGSRVRFRAGPRDVDGLQVARVDSCLRDGGDVLRLVVLRATHPAESIAGLLDDDAADVVEPGGFIRGANQCLVAQTQGAKRAIEADQFLFRALAFGDVLNAAPNERHAAAGVSLGLAAARHQPHVAVGAHQFQLERECRSRPSGPIDRRRQLREARRRVEAAAVIVEARRRQLRVAARDAIQLFGPGHRVGRRIPPPAADPREALRFAELLLPAMQRGQRASTFEVAAIDPEAAPDGQTGQQRDHRDDGQRCGGMLREETRHVGLP